MTQFIKLTEGAALPTRGTKNSAGHDFYALETIIIPAGEKCTILNP